MDRKIKKYNGVSFNLFEDIYESSLDDFINKELYIESSKLDNLITYEYAGSYFMLEYNNLENYAKSLDIFIGNFKNNGETESDGNQFPKVLGYWENNGLYYILVEAIAKLSDNGGNNDGVIKGVILDSINYIKK